MPGLDAGRLMIRVVAQDLDRGTDYVRRAEVFSLLQVAGMCPLHPLAIE